jgi:hypothetical protein
MKSLIRAVARAVWRSLAPLRRPFVRKLDRYLTRIVSAEMDASVSPALARLHQQMDGLIHTIHGSAQATDLALQSLVRELVRLQMQVEALSEGAERHEPVEREDLTLLDAEGAVAPTLRQTA